MTLPADASTVAVPDAVSASAQVDAAVRASTLPRVAEPLSPSADVELAARAAVAVAVPESGSAAEVVEATGLVATETP
jgi:hypothetical protein